MLTNYNNNHDDFKRMISLLELLPQETKDLAQYFISKLEAYRSVNDGEKLSILYTIIKYNRYPELTEYAYSRIKRSHEERDNDYDIGNVTFLKFMKVFGNIPHDDLVSLSPLNFCKLFFSISDSHKDNALFCDLCLKEAKEYELKLTESLFTNKNIEVQNYYRTVSSIYNYLQHNDSISASTSSLKTLSMILAMYYYNDPNEDFNLAKAFKECFPYINSSDIITNYLGLDLEDFEFQIKKSYDVGDLIISFKKELRDNDILESLKRLFGKKNSNGVLFSLCSFMNIDDDKLYASLDELIRLKNDSISDDELEKKYVEYISSLPIEDINAYNLASIIYKMLDADPNVLSYYNKTPDKLATLSLLLAMYVLNHKDLVYLENDGIYLDDLLRTLDIKCLIDQKYKLADIDKKIIVFQFNKFLEDNQFKKESNRGNPLITNLFTNGNRTFLKLLFIALDRDYDVLYRNILEEYTPKRALTADDIRKILARIKPELDVTSKDSIAEYGLDLMKHVNLVIDSMLKMSTNDENCDSFDEIRQGIGEIYETKEEKGGLLSVFRRKEKEVIVHFDYVNGLNEKIDENISRLLEQMKAYGLIELRNKLYAQKLKEFICYAKEKRELLLIEDNMQIIGEQDSRDLFEIEDYKTRKRMLDDKISLLETSYRTMEGHYMSVGIAILSTNSVINTLTHVRNDFIPLLSSNLLISIGATSASASNLIAKNVVDLTKSYLSNNLENAKAILGDLQALGIPEDSIKRIEGDIEERHFFEGDDSKILRLSNKQKKGH